MCLNMQNRKVDDVIDAGAPKPIEDLIAAAKTKVTKPNTQYKFHHKVTCMVRSDVLSGNIVCMMNCRYFQTCVNGISEWYEPIP